MYWYELPDIVVNGSKVQKIGSYATIWVKKEETHIYIG